MIAIFFCHLWSLKERLLLRGTGAHRSQLMRRAKFVKVFGFGKLLAQREEESCMSQNLNAVNTDFASAILNSLMLSCLERRYPKTMSQTQSVCKTMNFSRIFCRKRPSS